MAGSNFVQALAIASKDSAGMDGSFKLLGTLTKACSKLRFINLSNITLFISYNGVDTHDAIMANSSVTLDFQNNATPTNSVALWRSGTQIYVGAPAPGIGLIYLTGYYTVQG